MAFFLLDFFIFSLMATITNLLPLSLTFLFLLPSAFINVFRSLGCGQFSRLQFYLLVLLLYTLLSTLVYSPEALVEFDFYRRDGNLFPVYLFLLVVVFTNINTPNLIIDDCRWFLGFSIISVVGYIIYGMFFFFSAHNAAGGFYGVVSSFLFGVWRVKKDKYSLFCLLVSFSFLFLTDSRGSILAFVVASTLISFPRLMKNDNRVFYLFILLNALVVCYSYPVWLNMGKPVSEGATFSIDILNSDIRRVGTFIDRVFYLWPRAIDDFLKSPIFGMGFGSFDDIYSSDFSLLNSLLAVRYAEIYRHTSSHAHNSFFNIIAELGIVGFFIFVLLFNEIKKEIIIIAEKNNVVGLGLMCAFLVLHFC